MQPKSHRFSIGIISYIVFSVRAKRRFFFGKVVTFNDFNYFDNERSNGTTAMVYITRCND
jgi:hypothetical protein